MRLAALCTALLFALAAASAPAHAQSFTYQGELSSASGPANTPHDLQFRIFTLALGGVQVGTTTTQLNVAVTSGVFSATVSPGNSVFTGADRWLEIAVRPVGAPTYTTLTPRQRIAATPYAARSLSERLVDIGGGILTNSGPVDGSIINRLILNRTAPVTGADYFTVRTPTLSQDFGGMYIDTQAADGYPFYGFSTAGNVRGFAFIDGATGAFKLSVAGPRLTVSNTGLVGLGTEPAGPERLQVSGDVKATGVVTASDFAYSTPQTRTMSFPGEALRSADGSQFLNYDLLTGRAFFDGVVSVGYMVAPLNLPDGATVTGFDATLRNVLGTSPIQGFIIRRGSNGLGSSAVASLATSGVLNVPTIVNASPFAPFVVDAEQFVYHVRFQCADWDFTNNSVYAFRVRYTVPAP
jgi:hypothetical protein